jgi:PTH1 family peptidyl-tRNA hydrolase
MDQNFIRQNLPLKAIIGLGNPGEQYYYTRHSIGFRVVDAFAQAHHISWKSAELMEWAELPFFAHTGRAHIYLIKPTTFMNSSGKVIPWLQKKGIVAEQILVIHDELEKKFGSLMIKQGGSPRGHNGLRSIIQVIGENFWRLRFGIGRPDDSENIAHYVLSQFTRLEEEQLIMLLMDAVREIENYFLYPTN